jgi:hypothetical protein
MTLIISALDSKFVVQVSDRRLTRTDGRLLDDFANKAICVVCVDAVFSIAYTGLANINNKKTDEWLTDYLASINVGELTVYDIIKKLRKRLESTFLSFKHIGSARALTLVVAGFASRGVFAGQLSNIEGDDARRMSNIDDRFHEHFWVRDTTPMKEMFLIVHGAEQAILQTSIKSIRKIARRGSAVDSRRTVAPLVRLIRRAASDPKQGHVIGKNCMSVITHPAGQFDCRYHPDKASPISYAPNLIVPGRVYKGIEMSQVAAQTHKLSFYLRVDKVRR